MADEPEDRIVEKFIIAVVVIVLIALTISAVLVPWIAHRLHQDFYPPDQSYVGPNLLAGLIQDAVVLVVLACFWKPLKSRLARVLHKVNEPIHAKLNHIIYNHPDIPNEVEEHPDVRPSARSEKRESPSKRRNRQAPRSDGARNIAD